MKIHRKNYSFGYGLYFTGESKRFIFFLNVK